MSEPGELERRKELIKALYAEAGRDRLEEVVQGLHPDCIADWSRSRGPFKGVYRGRDEVLGFFAGVADAWDEVEYLHDELVEAGDRLVRVGRMRARGHASGIEIEATGAQVFEFRDGLIWRATLYQSRDEALAALDRD